MNEDIKIPCFARGEPTPDISWFFTSSSGPEKDVDVGTDGTDGTLFIPKARLEDSGTYTCTAQSFINDQLKEDKMVVQVNVLEQSRSPLELKLKSFLLISGTLLFFKLFR